MKYLPVLLTMLQVTFGCKKSDVNPVIVTPAPTITSFSPSSGTPGTTVSISGSNLSNIVSVNFNGVAAFFKTDGQNISAVVPGSSTSGALSVTTEGGSVTSSSPFTVLPNPGPTPSTQITAILPNNNPAGWPVLIQGVNIDSIKGIKFGNTVAQIDTNFAGVVTTRVPAGVAPGNQLITITNKYGDATTVAFTVLKDAPVVQTPMIPILFRLKARTIPHFQNNWINEANQDESIFLESDFQGNETQNDNTWQLTVTELDTLNAKTITLQIARALDFSGTPISFETYTGEFVDSDSPNKDRIIFWSEEGRQIVVSVQFQ